MLQQIFAFKYTLNSMDTEDTTTADRGIMARVLQVTAVQNLHSLQDGLQGSLVHTLRDCLRRGNTLQDGKLVWPALLIPANSQLTIIGWTSIALSSTIRAIVINMNSLSFFGNIFCQSPKYQVAVSASVRPQQGLKRDSFRFQIRGCTSTLPS